MEDPIAQAVGERVRRMRKRKGLTQTELGRRIGVLPCTINHLEAGRQSATLRRLYCLSIAMRCRVTELIPKTMPM